MDNSTKYDSNKYRATSANGNSYFDQWGKTAIAAVEEKTGKGLFTKEVATFYKEAYPQVLYKTSTGYNLTPVSK